MRVPLAIGATLVVGLGLLPGPLAEALASAVGPAFRPDVRTIGLAGIDARGIDVVLDPTTLLALTAALLVPVLVAVLVSARRHPTRVSPLPWAGGGSRLRPRMQYTATSYAEPLVRVFDDVLRPTRDVEVTHVGESRYLVERVHVEQSVSDVIETRLYRPVLILAQRFGVRARRAQNGSIHRYLSYSFVALLVVLIVVSL